jgi:hypothetical protein
MLENFFHYIVLQWHLSTITRETHGKPAMQLSSDQSETHSGSQSHSPFGPPTGDNPCWQVILACKSDIKPQSQCVANVTMGSSNRSQRFHRRVLWITGPEIDHQQSSPPPASLLILDSSLKDVSNWLPFLGRALPQNRRPSYLSRTYFISLR